MAPPPLTPLCKHEERTWHTQSHYNQITSILLGDYTHEHWSTPLWQIQKWRAQGFDHAHVMMGYERCAHCRHLFAERYWVLENPFKLTAEQASASTAAIEKVVGMICPRTQ